MRLVAGLGGKKKCETGVSFSREYDGMARSNRVKDGRRSLIGRLLSRNT